MDNPPRMAQFLPYPRCVCAPDDCALTAAQVELPESHQIPAYDLVDSPLLEQPRGVRGDLDPGPYL